MSGAPDVSELEDTLSSLASFKTDAESRLASLESTLRSDERSEGEAED